MIYVETVLCAEEMDVRVLVSLIEECIRFQQEIRVFVEVEPGDRHILERETLHRGSDGGLAKRMVEERCLDIEGLREIVLHRLSNHIHLKLLEQVRASDRRLDQGIPLFRRLTLGGIVDDDPRPLGEILKDVPEMLVDGANQEIGQCDEIVESHIPIHTLVSEVSLTLLCMFRELVDRIIVFLREVARKRDPPSVYGLRQIHQILGGDRFYVGIDDVHRSCISFTSLIPLNWRCKFDIT
jgi:hypothetical protein